MRILRMATTQPGDEPDGVMPASGQQLLATTSGGIPRLGVWRHEAQRGGFSKRTGDQQAE
ncbi:hypothetical protein D3C85_1776250 [compost metagenome]